MFKAYEHYLVAQEDVSNLLKCYDDINRSETEEPAPDVLKRATLVMILTAWETYVEDVACELFERKFSVLQGSHVGSYLEKNFQTELKRFHTPDSCKTRNLFKDYFGKDVTKNWQWPNVDPEAACAQLNSWIKKRGEAVHRMEVNIN
ncbi:HEPN domain-containing protein, partial [Sansalvadorimonas sp. 2012CJ34-2]